MRRSFSGTMALLMLALIAGPASAESIEIPDGLKPSFSGDYVVRATVQTENDVPSLAYSIYSTENDGKNSRIGAELPGVYGRPERLRMRGGEKRRVILSFKRPVTKPEQLAMCMWADLPKVENAAASQMRNVFRYCKLFTVNP